MSPERGRCELGEGGREPGEEGRVRNKPGSTLVGSFNSTFSMGIPAGMKLMSPKKTILKALSNHHESHGPGAQIRPSSIPGFEKEPEKYQKTINALLKDRIIEGAKDAEGRLAISLNTHRQKEIRRILRPVWARPFLLALLAAFAAAASVGILI